MGVARSTKDQVKFAFRRLDKEIPKDRETTFLLEYTDNKEWLMAEIKPEVERRFPSAKVVLQSLSLTTAVHVGPGSWGIAFLTEDPQKGNPYV